jgi:hypothetical protein
MNQKTLIGLLAVAIVAVGAAFAINHSRKPLSDVSAQAGTLVPGLRDHVNDVSRVSLVGANKQVLVSLERDGNGWKVIEKGGYPADVGKLRDYLLKLADATLLEQKTSNSARYADLGVTDMDDPQAKGIQVELQGLASPVQFIVGTFDGPTNGSFVRRVGESQSWLAKGSLLPDKNASDWLRKDLGDISSSRVASVSITRGEGKTLSISKTSEDDSLYTVANLPKGRELSSEYAPNGLASVLADLRFDDVAPTSEVAPAEDAIKARYSLFDGIVVDATSWLVGEKRYTTLKASLDQAKAEAYVASKSSTGEAPPEANSESAETNSSDGKGEEAKPSTADLEKEVASLNAAFDGWSFVLPPHKNANIDKSMDDLLKPLENAAGTKSSK